MRRPSRRRIDGWSTTVALLLGCGASALPLPAGSQPKAPRSGVVVQNGDIPVTFDLISIKGDKYVGAPGGPFATMFPDGVEIKKLVQGKITDDAFRETMQFGSEAGDNGGTILNGGNVKLEDLHICSLTDKKFAATSTGGKAFPTVKLSDDGKCIDFSGGNVEANGFVWMKIPDGPLPGTADEPIYSWMATPKQEEPKDEKKADKPPSTGNSGGSDQRRVGALKEPDPTLHFDAASGVLSFDAGLVDFAEYLDGTVVTTNGPTESIIGSLFTIEPTALLGPSPDLPGAFRFADTGLSITQGDQTFLAGVFTDLLLIPDSSVPGFDSVLQGSLAWSQSQAGLNSRFVDEFYFGGAPGEGAVLTFRSDLLGATAGLTTSGGSSGDVRICNTPSSIPEPGTVLLLTTGLAALGTVTAARRHR